MKTIKTPNIQYYHSGGSSFLQVGHYNFNFIHSTRHGMWNLWLQGVFMISLFLDFILLCILGMVELSSNSIDASSYN